MHTGKAPFSKETLERVRTTYRERMDFKIDQAVKWIRKGPELKAELEAVKARASNSLKAELGALKATPPNKKRGRTVQGDGGCGEAEDHSDEDQESAEKTTRKTKRGRAAKGDEEWDPDKD